MQNSREPIQKGIVIVAKFEWLDNGKAKGFGFIEPATSSRNEDRVFFAGFAMNGAHVEVGDEVSYILKTDPDPKYGPNACARKVFVTSPAVREEITTLYGENDYR